ncbi:MAG: hypothetical protein GF308_15360 [Candidatus Heimdallarchaeota archaeon]|nr:hypothetical protein [Candidatus Heimdallarchaeota archaeon]
MVAQIIISREDSTNFFSIGSVQDDASLVSALGGALTNFAIEMGLSEVETNNANYSKFQNGLLISEWLEINGHQPFLMIAIKDFENLEEYHNLFLREYGAVLARKIITTFEKMYSGEGEVPKLKNAIKIIPAVANEVCKSSPDTLKEFACSVEPSVKELLQDMWDNQSDKGTHPFPFRTEEYSPSKIAQMTKEFTRYFYTEGVVADALFPLVFAQKADLSLANKMVQEFLKQKARLSENEIAKEVERIIHQLYKMSTYRSQREKVEIESVDLLNADVIFEQISVANTDELEEARLEIMGELTQTLLQKLYQNFPLKFLAIGQATPIDAQFINDVCEKTAQPLIKQALSDSERISNRISLILREIVADLTPEEVINNREEIVEKVKYNFIKSIKKENPFIILGDPQLTQLQRTALDFATDAVEQYRTAHDEAMAFWYIIRQVNETVSDYKRITISKLMKVYFVQSLIRQYQFRHIPDTVYELAKEVLSEVAPYSSKGKDPTLALIKRNIKVFEEDVGFEIPKKTKNILITRLNKVKSDHQSFENIEALSFFAQAFNSALEATIVKNIQQIFGSGTQPMPPKLLTNAITKLVLTSQSLYSMIAILQAVVDRPGAEEIFTEEARNFMKRHIGYKTSLPTQIELAKLAFDAKWFRLSKKSLKSRQTKAAAEQTARSKKASKKKTRKKEEKELLETRALIPEYKIKGKIGKLIQDPVILTELWIKFGEQALINRYKALQNYMGQLKKQSKITAGNVTGEKRYSYQIKETKRLLKAYKKLLTGGGFFKKIFTRTKKLGQIIFEASRETFDNLNYYPSNFKTDPQKGLIFGKRISINIDPMIGNYQRLTEVYASTWVKNSEYVRRLKENLLWRILEKKRPNGNYPLERKIIENLHRAALRGRTGDQEAVVRTTIEQAVSLMFNKAVRETISKAFDCLEEDLLVRVNDQTKEPYILIGSIDLAKTFIKPICGEVSYVEFVKQSDKRTEIRLNLGELLPTITTETKQSQTIRVFLRDGLMEHLREGPLNALNILGEMTEQYIGEQAADLLFSHNRILTQLIIESIDQS